MFFQLLIPKESALNLRPGLERTLPPLLAENLKTSDQVDRWFAFSRNPDHSDLRFIENDHHLLIVLGYAGVPKIKNNLSIEEILDQLHSGNTIFSGQYLLVWFQKFSKITRVYTTISRSISCYYQENKQGLWLSNRQTGLAVANERGAEFDLSGCYPFLRNGYIPSEKSIFNGVSLCRSDSVTTFRENSEPLTFSVSEVLDSMGSEEGTEAVLSSIAESSAEAFTPMVSKPVKIGITGGRDSRLILASVARATDGAVETFTKGEDDDPDVIIGKQVASALRLKHSVQPPAPLKGGSIVRVNVVQRIKATILNGDFAISAYDNLSTLPKVHQLASLTFGGNGGELLRSPFAYANSNSESARKAIRAHGDGEQFVRKGFAEEYRDELERWLEKQPRDIAAASLLKKFSLLYRTGRWGAASYSAGYAKLSQRPFYDNGLLHASLRLNDHYATSEALYYELLFRINPELLKIPFDKATLNLKASPLDRYSLAADLLPPAVIWPPRKKRVSSTNWRRVLRGSLGEELYRIVSESHARNEAFRELIELASVRSLLDSQRSGMADTLSAKRMWSTATLALMVDQIGGTTANNIKDKSIEILLDS